MKIIFASLVFLSTALSASDHTVNVFLIGPGGVGSELINQVRANFSADEKVEIRLVGLANSRKMVFDEKGLDLTHWKGALENSSEKMASDQFVEKMVNLHLPHSVFVDCSSNQGMANLYPQVLESSIAVVTPNKKANSGPYLQYKALQEISEKTKVPFLYDANVGAGLPIIHVIKGIKRAGDSVTKLEAILSGTLSYLFNTYDGTKPFSELLKEAQQKGYTEPDPRDDLNGLDMARKFLILARESGLELEVSDITIEPFISQESFAAANVEDFYQRLAQEDDAFLKLVKQAKEEQKVLRFIGVLENGKATLSLQLVGQDHPFYSLSDTDNIVSIRSKVYSKTPIVIKGPGAGTKVTASNVLRNILEAGL